MNLTQLDVEILALPLQDRAALAQRLLLSLEEMSESEFERLWGEESARRLADFTSAYNKTIEQEGLPLDEWRSF
ncbi:addiction module protein [Methylomonas rosea]|uniref:Addiction module protein n=1 Tax=Methylomonas rosea TaxID=2952227 RepID=A0ABT1TNM4_9GAMM|nr:addiction module protein [Methylomonas sp. WSC-7]MCQ8116379.1 addiction module protein [Methylomonas sp. WSC-7]